MPKRLKKLLLFSTVLALIFLAFKLYQGQSVGANQDSKTDQQKIVITDKGEQAIFDLLDSNLTAINNKEIDTYLATLVPTAREASRKEIATFLDTYTVKNQLESFRVLKKDKTHCLVETKQKTINLGKKKYRNHIATANHTLKKVDGTWLIASTSMINTEFID